MELPHLGTHCAEPSCNKLDFLPFTCNLCKKEFCVDHHKYASHSCDESYRADVQVPICPLCDQPVPSKRGEPPDLAVNEHMENNCRNKKRKIYTNKCSASGCKTKEMIPVSCDSCRQNFCLRHRHPTDHDCKGAASPRELALAAATARSKSSGRNTQQQQPSIRRYLSPSSSTPRPTGHAPPAHGARVSSLQGGLSEEEALARAMAASVLEANGEPPNQSGGGGNLEQDEDVLLARTIAASLEESRRANSNSSQQRNSNSCNVC